MFKIIKTCKKHGALTINDVYIRNTRKGMDCRFCDKEYKIKQRLKDPEKFKEHGKKYRKIKVDENINLRKCSGCKKELGKNEFANYAWTLRYPYCKRCMSIANYKSKIKNKASLVEYKLKSAQISRKSYLQKTWGITLEQFDKMKKNQNNECAICRIKPKIFHIDHNHHTGKIRSLLCSNCNRGIGYLKESIDILSNAIDYLKYHSNI